jgi:hypothetical protein
MLKIDVVALELLWCKCKTKSRTKNVKRLNDLFGRLNDRSHRISNHLR